MAITDVVILYEDAVEEAKADKGKVRRSGQRVLLAKTDTKNPSFTDVAESTAAWPGLGNQKIPQINDEFLFGAYKLYVASRRFSWFKGTERGVQIDVRYEGVDEEANQEDQPGEEPSTWKRISISSSQVTVPANESRDVEGINPKPITNSAGDPVDGLEEETAIAVMKYTNSYALDPNLPGFYDWLNTVNQSPFLGAAKNTLRMTGFTADFDDATQLWSVTVELTYNPKQWRIGYYDAGFNELVSGERVVIKDKAGNPVSSPVPLDNTGQAKPVGQEPDLLYVYPYEQKNFSNLLADLRI
jgi:hypothetical protein